MPQQAATQTAAPAPVLTPQAPGTAAPSEIYQALRAQRNVLRDQVERLEDTRREIVGQLQQGNLAVTDRTGLEQRLAATDQQIARVSIDLAEAESKVAIQAAVPGATVDPPEPNPWQYGPSEDVVMMSIFMGAIILFPIAFAYARRLWKKQYTTVALSPDLAERIGQMERSIDTVAVEVERIGEGQRFVTQLLAGRAEERSKLAEGVIDRHV